MGVVWWAGGAAGVWLSRKGQRSVLPAVIIMLTGWAMSGHKQAVAISTHIHALFGYALIAGGVCRIIEICFVLRDAPSGTVDRPTVPGAWFPVSVFQYLPPFLLVAGGIMFMSATDEEMRWADAKGIDYVTWGLIDFSVAFLLFLWFNILIDTYVGYGGRYGLSGARQKQPHHFSSSSNKEHLLSSIHDVVAMESFDVPEHAPSQPSQQPPPPPRLYAPPPTTHILEDQDPFDDTEIS